MSKVLADDITSLSIRDVSGLHWLPGRAWTATWDDGSTVRLGLSSNGRLLTMSYVYDCRGMNLRIPVTTSRCRVGGRRKWFVCPLEVLGVPCKRRVGILFLKWGLFGCRHCHRLGYQSQLKN